VNIFLLSAFALGATASHAETLNLCTSEETDVFHCHLKKIDISLCLSSNGSFTYRAGRGKNIGLELSQKADGQNIFFVSSVAFAGGGEGHIRFSNHDYTYFLFDRTVKSDDGPVFSSGITIYKKGKLISQSSCRNSASIHQDAHSKLSEEQYQDLPDY